MTKSAKNRDRSSLPLRGKEGVAGIELLLNNDSKKNYESK